MEFILTLVVLIQISGILSLPQRPNYPDHAECTIYWTIGNSCENIRSELINQMKEWEGEANCGKTSVSCPRLPCGQNCLYKVSYIRMSKGPYFYYVRQIVGG